VVDKDVVRPRQHVRACRTHPIAERGRAAPGIRL